MTQLVQGHHFSAASIQLTQGLKQSPGILRRTQQVRRLHETGEFIGGEYGYVTRTAAAHEDHFAIIRYLIEKTGQLFT